MSTCSSPSFNRGLVSRCPYFAWAPVKPCAQQIFHTFMRETCSVTKRCKDEMQNTSEHVGGWVCVGWGWGGASQESAKSLETTVQFHTFFKTHFETDCR